jgi:hypothetical protein
MSLLDKAIEKGKQYQPVAEGQIPGYRWSDQCTFCKHCDSNAVGFIELEYSRAITYLCKNHGVMVETSRICDDFENY